MHLVPLELVKERLNLPVDHPIVDKLMEVWGSWAGRYREPLVRRPVPSRRHNTNSPPTGTSKQHDEAVAIWVSKTRTRLSPLPVWPRRRAMREVIKHCKHAAVVFQHQGKPGLAAFFAKIRQAST
ncbi:MAG: hypothetical protein IPN91_11775 [Holophagaceae bacterium]|uniref:Uncharacterized protein n=1 Tax=Candidatus Geothrix odensensis TaxID=2954440 RepID=A0A936F3N0_9BACT|nr:hypothetical protein [Candidatus Geothrix odensensis]